MQKYDIKSHPLTFDQLTNVAKDAIEAAECLICKPRERANTVQNGHHVGWLLK